MPIPNYKLDVLSKLSQQRVFQVTFPANLLCYDLLSLLCNRGDGRFVLKETDIQAVYAALLLNPN